MAVPVTVVIITKNEEHNMDDCLKSVHGWADEIIVVDDESSDRTIEKARAYGAKVFQRKMESEGSHRNWAYAQARNRWVFSLDADERLTQALRDELTRAITSDPLHTHFTVPRKNHLGSYWMRWGGQYPAAQVKLLLKDKFLWEDTGVHPRAFAQGTCGHLKEPMIHYTYRDIADALRKLNNQTTLEALKWAKLRETNRAKADGKMNAFHTLWRCFDRFFRSYLFRQGWRDGVVGFIMAYFGALYQWVSFLKYYEIVSGMKGKK